MITGDRVAKYCTDVTDSDETPEAEYTRCNIDAPSVIAQLEGEGVSPVWIGLILSGMCIGVSLAVESEKE